MTGTNCDLFTHKSSRSYLNHLVIIILGTIYLISGLFYYYYYYSYYYYYYCCYVIVVVVGFGSLYDITFFMRYP
jgi:uncharacterized membrane protein YdbT with pleckstrin-like domain